MTEINRAASTSAIGVQVSLANGKRHEEGVVGGIQVSDSDLS